MSQDTAFEKWFIDEFKGGFPTKSLDGLIYSSIRTTNLWQAWEAATAEANKRIAELESDNKIYAECNAELKENFNRAITELSKIAINLCKKTDKNAELQASNNTLREALEESNKLLLGFGEPFNRKIANEKALSATQAESLQAFENEVLERAAKKFDDRNFHNIGKSIRALKEVK